MNKKVITFCVYGKDPKYSVGILNAVQSAITYYDDWEIWVYVCNGGYLSVPEETLNDLNKMTCKVIPYKDYSSGLTCEGMFRRFSLFNDETVDYWISRDADSRCTLREKKMVDEWVDSKKTIHTILDHGCHRDVMGGTFGVCNINLREKYPEKLVDIDNFLYNLVIVKGKQINKYNDDQEWLRSFLQEIVVKYNDFLVHIPKTLNHTNRIYGKDIADLSNCYIVTEYTRNFVGKPSNTTT
tara:strand:+ start:15961 stop:16680 length:720 start_codon:yes stop_codon:yes gene_type:complete